MQSQIQKNVIRLSMKQLKMVRLFIEEKKCFKRFFYAAKKTNADFILRVTSDCPLQFLKLMKGFLRT